MEYNTLVADRDEAFASFLKERLEDLGEYRVTIVSSGDSLLESVIAHRFDLLVVDVTLRDFSSPELLNRIHALQPSLRIMVIPYPGNQVPFALKDILVHGLLPKPFITEDLPLLIRRVLEAEIAVPLGEMANLCDPQMNVSEEDYLFALFPEEGATFAKSARGSDQSTSHRGQDFVEWDTSVEQLDQDSGGVAIPSEEVLPVLRALEHELQAILIVLSSKAGLLAHTGSFHRERAENFCRFVTRRVESGIQLMHFLGADDGSIAMMLDEGEKHRVYTTRVTPTVWLTVVLEFHIPIGSLRYHIRKTVEQIVGLLHNG